MTQELIHLGARTSDEQVASHFEAAKQNYYRFDLDKEYVQRTNGEAQVVRAALELLQQAAAKKAKPEEVRAWADKAVKTAEDCLLTHF